MTRWIAGVNSSTWRHAPSRCLMRAEFLRAWFAPRAYTPTDSNPAGSRPSRRCSRTTRHSSSSRSDFDALRAFTEILIPTDETPGAREAHCAHFIDFILQASPDGPQTRWRDAMRALKNAGFHDADQRPPPRAGRRHVETRARPGGDTSGVLRVPVDQGAEHVCVLHVPRRNDRALDYKGNSFNATFPHASMRNTGGSD